MSKELIEEFGLKLIERVEILAECLPLEIRKHKINQALCHIYLQLQNIVRSKAQIREKIKQLEHIIARFLNSEKEKVSEDIGKKISNYFSGIADSIVNPGKNNSCEPTQSAD